MRVTVNLGGEYSSWLRASRALGLAIKPVLEALVMVDLMYLRTHHTPFIYASGVRYQEEPRGEQEEFAAVPVILARGWGDCDDLAPWLCAYYRSLGEKARIRIQWKRTPNGKLYHVVVRRANGQIEDPSRVLGMGSNMVARLR